MTARSRRTLRLVGAAIVCVALGASQRAATAGEDDDLQREIDTQRGSVADLERLDELKATGDEIVQQEGVRILIDDFSAPYIRGSEIDYVDSLMGAGFTVHNPNAVSSCSCGHSFDTGDDAGQARACGCGH